MAFGELKRRADLLAAEAARLQGERNAHARRSLAQAREWIATPGALAVCFAAGFLLATPRRTRRGGAKHVGRQTKRPTDRHAGQQDDGHPGQALAGALATLALRLATSFLARGGVAGAPPRAESPAPRGEPPRGSACRATEHAAAENAERFGRGARGTARNPPPEAG